MSAYHGFYDWAGQRITDDEYKRQYKAAEAEGRDWKRVDRTTVGDADVSTVHILVDHRHGGDGPPLIFETLVFGGGRSDEGDRYATEAEARAGHAEWVEKCRVEQDAFTALAERDDVRAAVLGLLAAQAAYRDAVGTTDGTWKRTDDFDRLVARITGGAA